MLFSLWCAWRRRIRQPQLTRHVTFLHTGREDTKTTANYFPDNILITARYTLFTFLPLALFAQFRRLPNVYFLLIAVLQLSTELSSNAASEYFTVLPLVGVLFVSMAKEAMEDFARHLSDMRNNAELVAVLRKGSQTWVRVPTHTLVVGDFVRITEGEVVPADLVLLAIGGGVNSAAYFNTAQLDGENSLKPCHVLSAGTDACGDNPLTLMASLEGAQIECGAPCAALDFFTGTFTPAALMREVALEVALGTGVEVGAGVGLDNHNVSIIKPCAVGINNLLVRGMLMRYTRWAVGVVVYTGADTKVALNSAVPPIKHSPVERSFDRVLLQLCAILLGCCLIVAIGAGVWTAVWTDVGFNTWYLTFQSSTLLEFSPISTAFLTGVASLLLFNNLIPISLVVTVEIARLLQARTIRNDTHLLTVSATGDIVPAQVLSSSLNESLGLVDCIVTDKTGTLTQNKFNLRALSIGGQPFMNDAKTPSAEGWDSSHLLLGKKGRGKSGDLSSTSVGGGSDGVADTLLCLALCNEVLAQRLADGTLEYQSSSPDDVALVRGAAQLGLHVLEREHSKQSRLAFDGQIITVDILAVYGFNSTDRRRMSVLVRFPGGRCVLFSKGADSHMLPCMKNIEMNDSMKRGSVEDQTLRDLDSFACSGLRTLVLAAREMSPADAESLLSLRAAALNEVGELAYKAAMVAAAAAAEKDMELLGVSAIEDCLAPDVAGTIGRLTKAGISIVMCTGDKIETAVSVAISTNIASQMTDSVILRSADRFANLAILAGARLALKERKLWCPGVINRDLILVVEGAALDKMIEAFEEEAIRSRNGLVLKSASAASVRSASRGSQVPRLPEVPTLVSLSADLAARMKAGGMYFINSLLPGDREISGVTGVVESDSSSRHGDDSARGIRATMAAVAAATTSLEDGNVRRDFEEFLEQSGAVLFCRVSPLQKVKVVRLLQSVRVGTPRITLAVGDGANDVGMIQAADVGVGIIGIEGTRVASSADFALGSFSALSGLLLVHGRSNYRRITLIIVFSIYKNALLVVLVLCYSAIAAWSSVSFFDSYAASLWNIFFTSLPILSVGVGDTDLPPVWVLGLPGVYSSGRSALEPSSGRMGKWLLLAFYQAVIIGAIAFVCFTGEQLSDGTDPNMIADGLTVHFACLITVTLQLTLETRAWRYHTLAAVIISIVFWFIYIACASIVFDTLLVDATMYGMAQKLLSRPGFWLMAIIAPFAAMAPGIVMRTWARNVNPTLSEFMQERAALGPFVDTEWSVQYVSPILTSKPSAPLLKRGRSRFDVLKTLSTTLGICGENLGVSGSVWDSDAFQKTIKSNAQSGGGG